MTALVNDLYSRLNPTAVEAIVRPRSVGDLQDAVRAASGRMPVAVCGGRHAMGGQQFCRNGVLIDTTALDRILSLDTDGGLVEVEAGIRWPALMRALALSPRAIRQKQAGRDELSLGGSVAVNAHGRGLGLGPLVCDVERLTLVDAGGALRVCSRHENSELFRLACGGYGLFGVIASVTLRLARRTWYERTTARVRAEELIALLHARARQGCTYGEALLEIDPSSDGFLRRGVATCYRRAAGEASPPQARDDRRLLSWLARTDKARAFEVEAAGLLAASGDLVGPDAPQLDGDLVAYRWPGAGEVMSRLHVPRIAVAEFLAAAAHELRVRQADVARATVGLVDRDDETALGWAREPWAVVAVHLYVDHDPVAVGRAADACRAVIDLALDHGGAYDLANHRWARRDQLERAHPRIDEFLRSKREHDPRGVFQSDWYRHVLALLDVGERPEPPGEERSRERERDRDRRTGPRSC